MLITGPVSAQEQEDARNISLVVRPSVRLWEKEARDRQLSPDAYILGAGSFSISAVGDRSAACRQSVTELAPPNDRMEATALIAKMREQGLLPSTSAKLVILQPEVQETQSFAIGQVSARLASHRLNTNDHPTSSVPQPSMMAVAMEPGAAVRITSVVEDSVAGAASTLYGATDILLPGVPPSDDTHCSPPLDAGMQGRGDPSLPTRITAKSARNESNLLAGPQSLQTAAFGSLGQATGQWAIASSKAAPLEPESPHLDDREPTTPLSDEQPPAPLGTNPRPVASALSRGNFKPPPGF